MYRERGKKKFACSGIWNSDPGFKREHFIQYIGQSARDPDKMSIKEIVCM